MSRMWFRALRWELPPRAQRHWEQFRVKLSRLRPKLLEPKPRMATCRKCKHLEQSTRMGQSSRRSRCTTIRAAQWWYLAEWTNRSMGLVLLFTALTYPRIDSPRSPTASMEQFHTVLMQKTFPPWIVTHVVVVPAPRGIPRESVFRTSATGN